jgi:hypothetical protein
MQVLKEISTREGREKEGKKQSKTGADALYSVIRIRKPDGAREIYSVATKGGKKTN